MLETATAHGGRVIAIQALDAGIIVDSPEAEHFRYQVAWDHLDGLIVAQNAVSESYLAEFAATGKPVVGIYREPAVFGYPVVVPDNGAGITAAVDHLITHGHTTIAFCARDPANADDWMRREAYERAMLARNLSPLPVVEVPWQLDETFEASRAVRDLLASDPVPTAVIACTDLTAMALIPALLAAGISVPEEMAVVGFDDIADAATFQPALATIAQNFPLVGATACELVLAALAGQPAPPGFHPTPVSFIQRESCGCAGPSREPAGDGDPRGENVTARLLEDLEAAVYSDRAFGLSRRRELVAVTEGLIKLFTTVAEGAEAAIMADLSALAAELRQLLMASANPMRAVTAIRRFARSLAGGDLAATARLERCAFDLAIRVLEHRRITPSGQTIVHQKVDIQRRYYMISTDLVRRRARDSRSLSWLEATEFRAGCLGVWEAGRGNSAGASALELVGSYHRAGRYRPEEDRCEVRGFPPRLFVDLIDEEPGHHGYLYILPVRFDGSDWGFLALTGPIDVREGTAFERYNHWAVLLTVALDHEHARYSERALLEDIRLSEERYALASEAANDGLWDWDLSGPVYYSARWKSLLGFSEDEIAPVPEEWLNRIHPDDRPRVDRVLARHFRGGGSTLDVEYRLRAADGTYRWMLTHGRSMRDETGQVVRLIGSMADITDRKLLEDRLRRDAHYDVLTGLPNRTLFLDRLNRAIERVRRQPDYEFAVAFLDLDGFKVINDSLGHQIGDEVLIRVADRLKGELRFNDTVSRFGGDEFVLLLDDIRHVFDLPATIRRILSAVSAPLHIGERNLAVSAAAGIAVSTSGYREADEYLRDADTAMYRAKASGNGSLALFDTSMHTGAMTRLQLESDLRQAVTDHQFELFYQPILELTGRTMVGMEALLRWRHPRRGLVSPAEFLPVAETTGLVRNLGLWTLRAACGQIRDWLDEYPHARIPVSINLSNRQFWDPDLRAYLHTALADFDIPPSMLVFEVTEGVIMHSQEKASKLMARLRADGIQLHVDDFGTGYSSLAALHTFPIDALKIDRSFVARIASDARSRELVRIMIAMGVNLGIVVIGEGVETEEEAAILAELACPLVQGYLFSRPVAATAIPPFFAS